MVELPTVEELEELKTYTEQKCVSIYIPNTVDNGTATSPEQIRFKNTLSKAKKTLEKKGMRPKEARKILKEGYTLQDDMNFWNLRGDGLAVFLHEDFIRTYRTPNDATPHKLSVGDGFDTEPLENMQANNEEYYLLSLGHKNVHVYKGDKYHLQDVTPKNFPTDMKKALNIDEYPNMLETHTVAPTRGNRESESFHGQYNVKQEDKKDLLKFFRKIDLRLKALLQRDNSPPLVIAGVENLVPIYKKANTYHNLLEGSIMSNIQHQSKDKIVQRIKPLVGLK